ncbi:hypothetical protein H4R24_005198 [Coemansia sp. RSA 988]|nr:hypothetical protein H4R24_005198 [Coemansia sp. RSA 988]
MVCAQCLINLPVNERPWNCSYLQYSSIAARALRRVAKAELQTEIAKREGVNLKFAKWEGGKSGAYNSVSTVETRPKAQE